MSEAATTHSDTPASPTLGTRLPSLEEAGFETLEEKRPPGLIRRLLVTQRHTLGLAAGGLIDWVRTRRPEDRQGFTFRIRQLVSVFARLLVAPSYARQPFPVQLRRRLEGLGPTYIKLGQILSLRQDLLPRAITDELKRLLDRLPALPYERFLELVAQGLRRPVDEAFSWIEPVPLGSASIAQSHRATTRDGEPVVLKVVKPGNRKLFERDAVLLRALALVLQFFLPRYQPRPTVREFLRYTRREFDLQREADHSETFAANFRDEPDVRFPRIHRELSSKSVLCMELFEGHRPDSPEAQELDEEAKDRVIDLGAGAIVRMLYRDGFFHADLHPGNLIILPGPQAGFIDLGMVGRLDDGVRRTLLYYYYSLAAGDAKTAARYLCNLAKVDSRGDLDGFRRDVEDLARRWRQNATFENFSLGRLILESVGLSGEHGIYFPVEMVLISKALVTFEGVGHQLKPGFDVAAVTKRHVGQVILQQLSPLRLARDGLRGAPEVLDALVKTPLLVSEGLRLLEDTTKRSGENPFAGIRGTLFGGFCLVAGAISSASGGPWPLWTTLFVVGLLTALNPRR